jgi:hypothetical protein
MNDGHTIDYIPHDTFACLIKDHITIIKAIIRFGSMN